MFWFDPNQQGVLFGDIRSEEHTLCDRRALSITPDVLMDFRDIPYPDASFRLVAFDPPHLRRAGRDSWLRAKYGIRGDDWREELRKGNRTVNIALQRVVRVLNLCTRKWRDDRKRPWIDSVPMIEMLCEKNGDERLVVLNNTANAVINKQRGIHPEWVFPYEGTAMHRMNDSAWRKARIRAANKWEELNGMPAHPGFRKVQGHDLKHTFGRRLRVADVPEEDRKVLLGHTNGSVTSHCSGAEPGKLVEYANRIIATDQQTPVLTFLKESVILEVTHKGKGLTVY